MQLHSSCKLVLIDIELFFICILGMKAKTAFLLIIILIWVPSFNAIIVSPGINVTEGNCSGPLDYFLCNCTELNTTIDIHLSSGQYNFTHKQPCLLQNKTSIKITGKSSDETVIKCQEPFNIMFMEIIREVIISNLTMDNCGNVVDDLTQEMVNNTANGSMYLGSGFRCAIMFYQVRDINISEFTMQNTLGYGIVAFNAIGKFIASKIKIENTTFENDPKCDGFDYNSNKANYICSGSGISIVYYDINELDFNNETKLNAVLTIDQSNFTANRNFLPYEQLMNDYNNIFDTGFYQTSFPLLGAGSIGILYLQSTYDVNATITNSVFYNNNGTLSASIAIGSFSTIRGITHIKNCVFDDNNRISKSSSTTSVSFRGGISYQYLILKNAPIGSVNNMNPTMVEIVTVIQCNFTRLGGMLGAAFHIEKVSTDFQSLSFKIEQCNFSENEANIGSAVYAITGATLYNSLIINLVNVNAKNNVLLPGSTIQYRSSDFISGVFHCETCHMKFDCSINCEFFDNMPSVFYGHSAYLTISGKAIFINNTARYGGGLRLINTVAFIHQDSEVYFYKNHATENAGAINIDVISDTNTHYQDVCPIQFVGLSNASQITSVEDIDQFNINVTFEENTAMSLSMLESIFADVFYVCTWYENTAIQIDLGFSSPVINGTRQSVYHEIFNFVPASKVNEHLSILAYLPCPCDENNIFDTESCLNSTDSLQLPTTVILGRSFTINLVALDVVGSVGYSSYLNSEVSSLNTTENILQLPSNQLSRSFSVINRTCTPIDFRIYAFQSIVPETGRGMLRLSILQNFYLNLNFSFAECPIGFSLQIVDELYVCTCGEFFSKLPINKDFQCNTDSGQIKRLDIRSWLSVIDDRIEYTRLCLAEYCNNIISEFSTTDNDALCNPDRTGRGCGSCVSGFGKAFGSRYCRKCSNVWLLTILVYGILGIILVLIIHLLKLTVTTGTINGVIFFCNIMSVSDSLFFNPSKFSFVRLFVSLINLDLGFEMCFYSEMSEVAKTGLQFVFPLYLWLLMFIIIMIGKHYIRSKKSTHSAVPVLATLIFLSYSKLLRTTISVFSFVTVHYSTKESNFSRSQQFIAWQPDPNIKYLAGSHIVLFLLAVVFTAFFILPLAFALTFPKTTLRSTKMSYFFPLLDCIYAPYKNKYRYWFGVRLILLIYISGMESILFSYRRSLLFSVVIVVLLFTLIQTYIHPFKSTINNILDLTFMEIFITLSVVVFYLYPNTPGHEEFIAVNTLGGVAILLFCLITLFHIHDAITHCIWFPRFNEALKVKFNIKIIKDNWNPLVARYVKPKPDDGFIDDHACLQESLLEDFK